MKGNNKGITLIALVITIIILIILAAISISMLLGDEGIIERAKRASANYTVAAEEEQEYLEYLNGLLDDDTFEEARGNGTLSGEGTESSPYLIQSIEDLVYLSNQVKGGNNYTGECFRLEISLDFKDRRSYLNPDSKDFGDINEDTATGTLFEELTTGKGFYPIGKDSAGYYFEGIFDGNNKSISNIQGRPLFGHINNSTIKNLKMLNVNILYGQGGITNIASGTITISDCQTTGEINYSGYKIGGIIGKDSSGTLRVSSTSNGINITSTSAAAGIVGDLGASSTFENCSNTGNLTGAGYIGGIAGDTYGIGSYGTANFTNCYNSGTITATSSYVGGIEGRPVPGTISYCYNTGEINCRGYAGGIVGAYAASDQVPTITHCYNTGTINATGSVNYIGGIMGNMGSANKTISYCYNTGAINITGTASEIGGICGMYGNIENCYNTGDITIQSPSSIGSIGGILGYASGSNITNCYNTGKIAATSDTNKGANTGGIVGYDGRLTNCYNIGEIETNSSLDTTIGSVAGYPSSISSCYYLEGTYEVAIGRTSDYDVTSFEDEDTMKSTMNTKFATIEGWKASTTGGYPEFQ